MFEVRRVVRSDNVMSFDLNLTYKKPINVDNNAAYISVNKLPKNNNENETKYLIIR